MTPSLENLAARVQRLEDLDEIRSLIASYGPLADSGEAGHLARLWDTGGSYEVVGFDAATGHDRIAGLIDGAVHRGLMAQGCAHVLGPVAIELANDRARAHGHSVVFRHLKSADGGRFEAYRVAANRWELQRCADGWRVTKRTNALLDGQEAARQLFNPPIVPRPPRTGNR